MLKRFSRRGEAAQEESESPAQPTLRRPIVILAIAVVVVVGLRLLPTLTQVLLVIFGAVTLSVLVDGVSNWISRHTPLPRWLSMTLFVMVCVAALVGVGWLMGDRISGQFNEMSQRVTQGYQNLQAQLQKQEWSQNLLSLSGSGGGPPNFQQWMSRIGGFFSTTVGVVANVFVLMVLSLYLAATPKLYIRGIGRLVPPEKRDRYRELMSELGSQLRWWFVGRFSSMAVTGLLTGIGLWIAGVPLALSLGIIAGLLSFVPFIGPIVASIPGILVAWVQSPQTALYALGVYIGVQLLESNLITPLIQKRAVSVPPALLVGGQLLIGSLFGFWGVFWTTPLIVVLMVIIRKLYVEDVLHDEVGEAQNAS